MPVNADKAGRWKEDIVQSVDFYNEWFIRFAPETYRNTRGATTLQVEEALTRTANLTDIDPAVLRESPTVLPMLRMATAPPIARDRLTGLAGLPRGLVKSMEVDHRIPPKMASDQVETELRKIGQLIRLLADVVPNHTLSRRIAQPPSSPTGCAARLPILSFATPRNSANLRL